MPSFDKPASRPTARALLWEFSRIGNLTFGGGMPTIAALRYEFVVRRGWLTEDQFGIAFGLARVTPGTVMLAYTTAIGWQMLGWTGALIGLLASCVPQAALVVWLTHTYQIWKDNPVAQAVIAGLIAAAVGVMAAVAVDLMKPGLRTDLAVRTSVLVIGPIVLMLRFGWSPVPIIGLAAIAGLVWPDGQEPE